MAFSAQPFAVANAPFLASIHNRNLPGKARAASRTSAGLDSDSGPKSRVLGLLSTKASIRRHIADSNRQSWQELCRTLVMASDSRGSINRRAGERAVQVPQDEAKNNRHQQKTVAPERGRR